MINLNIGYTDSDILLYIPIPGYSTTMERGNLKSQVYLKENQKLKYLKKWRPLTHACLREIYSGIFFFLFLTGLCVPKACV